MNTPDGRGTSSEVTDPLRGFVVAGEMTESGGEGDVGLESSLPPNVLSCSADSAEGVGLSLIADESVLRASVSK